MEPFYSNCEPDNELCALMQEHEELRIRAIRRLLPDLDHAEDLDFPAWLDSYAAQLGMHPLTLQYQVFALRTLEHLPQLTALREELHHLPMSYLTLISEALAPVDKGAGSLDFIDADLTAYLTPKQEYQPLPKKRTLKAWILRWLKKHAPELFKTRPKPPEPGKPQVSWATTEDDLMRMTADWTTPDGTLVRVAVLKAARKHHIPQEEALLKLVTGQISATATLNFIEAQDKLHLVGAGALSDAEEKWARGRITHQRNITSAGCYLSSTTHDAPEAVATFVTARDGHCRYPGCAATRNLQLHHVIGFDHGGPTTASNLACLCPHHHNKVTFGHVRMFMTETGTCSWHYRNGNRQNTSPEGPLADAHTNIWAISLKEAEEQRIDQWRRVNIPPDPHRDQRESPKIPPEPELAGVPTPPNIR